MRSLPVPALRRPAIDICAVLRRSASVRPRAAIALRMPGSMTSPPKSILVVSLRYFGDVLLTTPLIRALAERHREAAIDVLLIAGTEQILEGNRNVRETLTIAQRAGVAEHRALAARLWRRYDLAVVAETGDRPHFYGWLASAERAGLIPADRSTRWWKRLLLRQYVQAHPSRSRIDMYRNLAETMGLPFRPVVTAPTAGVSPEQWSERLGFDVGRCAVLHIAPRFRYKRWHARGWRTVTEWLHERGLRIVITGGDGAAERGVVREALAGCAVPTVDLAGGLRFAETADLLRAAALYVGPDTATSHLAAACGTPSIVLFGPTDPRLWGPLPAEGLTWPYVKVAPVQRRANVVVLQEPSLPCVPCQGEGCERHRDSYSSCLDRLRAERVIDVARTLLGS